MEIYPATAAEHLPAVRELFKEYVAWLVVDLTFQGFPEELAGLPGKYAPPAGGIWLAGEAGQIAGCIAFRPFAGDACEMKRLYIRPAFQRRGLGGALAMHVLNVAAAAGYRRMYLDTLSSMLPAVALYKKLGFRECPPYYHNPHADAVYFEKTL